MYRMEEIEVKSIKTGLNRPLEKTLENGRM